ncbi:hypothetical protein [Pelagicoccus sp. SDUM812003]|uniref:hypothetical protein n=1 Tax=Pelagicoccus sp. SDUM812003 TaxID=3041267 RepID=UPI00280FEE0C|nr:hypothetical protein [Pelagicoccus sp. SDUM812003]MDQ8202235.1 hypothetical protein [Pelagicoccus sp. SDUM812003]
MPPIKTPPSTANHSALYLDLREFIRWIEDDFEPSLRRNGSTALYARHPEDDDVELYGICDMASVLYTIDRLPVGERNLRDWSEAINSFQTEAHGWFAEKKPTHAVIHNTAYALSTLKLLGLNAKETLSIGPEFTSPKTYLLSLDWKERSYPESHFGAGIGSICALADELRISDWFDEYFETCDSLCNHDNGLLGIDKPAGGDIDQIGGSFHYAFLYHHFNRQMPYPEARINTVLNLQKQEGYWDENNQLWLTLDALYLLTRTSRQTHHRFAEVKEAARRVARLLERNVFSAEGRAKTFAGKQPAHALAAAITAAAELQNFLGIQSIYTDRPLRNILDRRPFI